MNYRISILLAACFCGGCFSSHEGASHAPAIAVNAIADFNGVYSNQRIDAEMVGENRSLGLFEHILFYVRPHPFDVADKARIADSVRIIALDKTLAVDALKDGRVVAAYTLQQERDFKLSSKGITLRDEREKSSDSFHGLPLYQFSHRENYMRLADDGSLIFEQRGSGMFFVWYVVPVHLSRVTETSFRRIQRLPNKAPEDGERFQKP